LVQYCQQEMQQFEEIVSGTRAVLFGPKNRGFVAEKARELVEILGKLLGRPFVGKETTLKYVTTKKLKNAGIKPEPVELRGDRPVLSCETVPALRQSKGQPRSKIYSREFLLKYKDQAKVLPMVLPPNLQQNILPEKKINVSPKLKRNNIGTVTPNGTRSDMGTVKETMCNVNCEHIRNDIPHQEFPSETTTILLETLKNILQQNGGQLMLNKAGTLLRENPIHAQMLDSLKSRGTNLTKLILTKPLWFKVIPTHSTGLHCTGYAGVRLVSPEEKVQVSLESCDTCALSHNEHLSSPNVEKSYKYQTVLCKYWAAHRTCQFGDKCTFIHKDITCRS